MIKIFKKYFIILSLSFILIVGLLISLKQISQPMIAEADAYSRVNVAISQKKINLFFNKYGGTWLPFHFSLMVVFLSKFDYPLLIPRIITLILSLGSIVSIYFYTKRFQKNKTTALIASLLFLLFPLRIYLGTQTLSEPIFIFFLIISFIFISGEKLSYKEILLSLLFLNIAHGIRYESWMILPLVWFFIINKPINLNKKITYIFYSILFPIYWLYLNSINTGSFLTFFNQKYEVAQKYQIIQYFNFNLSFVAWEEKLIKIFPIPFLALSLFDLRNLFKKFITKNIFYYFLPFFFFLALVVQVFFGTMEWFPTRYLLIPTTFLIPLLASSIHEIISFTHSFFLKQTFIKKMYSLFFIFIFIFIFQNKYFSSLNHTRLEITDWSLLQTYDSYETTSNSTLYNNFINLIKECKQICDNSIVFLYEEERRTYFDQGLFYFLNRPGIDISKNNINYIENNTVFIWERNDNDESKLIKNFEILYKNEKFYILKKNKLKLIYFFNTLNSPSQTFFKSSSRFPTQLL